MAPDHSLAGDADSPFVPIQEQVRSRLDALRRTGSLDGPTQVVTVDIHPGLLEQARRLTGINDDRALVEAGLAMLAIVDYEAAKLLATKSTLDPEFDIER